MLEYGGAFGLVKLSGAHDGAIKQLIDALHNVGNIRWINDCANPSAPSNGPLHRSRLLREQNRWPTRFPLWPSPTPCCVANPSAPHHPSVPGHHGIVEPQWSSILMLRNLKSPETYFQAAFRVQSPWSIKNPNGDNPNEEEILKPVCFVFDFAPTRALRQLSDYAIGLSPNEPYYAVLALTTLRLNR